MFAVIEDVAALIAGLPFCNSKFRFAASIKSGSATMSHPFPVEPHRLLPKAYGCSTIDNDLRSVAVDDVVLYNVAAAAPLI